MFRGQKQYLELQNLHFQKGLLQRSNQQDYFYRSKKKIKQLGHEVQMSPIVFNFLILILFFFLSAPLSQRGRKCSRTHKAPEPHRLSYAGCRSTRLYRPNYCGVCRDGRCCWPRRTRTAPVTFACPDGERFSRSVMFIQSCKCSDQCNHLNEAAMPPQQRWLYGDTHKFLD